MLSLFIQLPSSPAGVVWYSEVMKKSTTLQAAVFDVDGMLLDTREFILQAFEDTLKRYGYAVPSRTVISKEIGRSLQTCYVNLAPNGDVEALCLAHDKFQNTPEMLGLIRPYPGVPEMLQQLKDAGLHLAVFSSRMSTLVSSLEQTGIANFFEIIVQGDEVTRHKPHPEGLFKALAGLGVAPKRAAMLGDAAVDILAGKAADVAITIGITHGFGTAQELQDANPDYVVADPSEIPALLLGKTMGV
jgi:HAD superfamily hydrolase (TIGR01509 family)